MSTIVFHNHLIFGRGPVAHGGYGTVGYLESNRHSINNDHSTCQLLTIRFNRFIDSVKDGPHANHFRRNIIGRRHRRKHVANFRGQTGMRLFPQPQHNRGQFRQLQMFSSNMRGPNVNPSPNLTRVPTTRIQQSNRFDRRPTQIFLVLRRYVRQPTPSFTLRYNINNNQIMGHTTTIASKGLKRLSQRTHHFTNDFMNSPHINGRNMMINRLKPLEVGDKNFSNMRPNNRRNLAQNFRPFSRGQVGHNRFTT